MSTPQTIFHYKRADLPFPPFVTVMDMDGEGNELIFSMREPESPPFPPPGFVGTQALPRKSVEALVAALQHWLAQAPLPADTAPEEPLRRLRDADWAHLYNRIA